METQTKPFATIRSSAIDGRAHNPFFRKTQLKKLHQALVKNSSELQNSAKQDGVLTTTEIKIEYLLALQCVAHAHDGIDPKKALEDEYTITTGVDNAETRAPVGIVVIEPSPQAFLNSLVSALVPALAGGNCIIVETGISPQGHARLVLDILSAALDNTVLLVSNRPVMPTELMHPHVRVAQNYSGPVKEGSQQLISVPTTPVVALVERDAHIEQAARALVAARFGRGGKSPYAPDIILVNEWVKKRFLEAVVLQNVQADGEKLRVATESNKSLEFMADTKDGDVTVISTGGRGTILDVHNRSVLIGRKVQHASLVIHPVKSIDDAIDVSRRFGTLAAAYVYSTPAAAKYFFQFVQASANFMNQVPTWLLHGPAAPAGHALQAGSRNLYNIKMFTVPRPQFVSVPKEDSQLQTVTDGQLNGNTDLDDLIAKASGELKDTKRPRHGSPIGFFEQGIITGLAMTLTVIVGSLIVSGYYVFHKYCRPSVL